jgi:hypothetical protein
MDIQFNTDNHTGADPAMEARSRETVEGALGRFAGMLTRVELHLSDVNAARGGPQDKHCTLEARPEGRRPVVASASADSHDGAVRAAAKKLRAGLETEFGRLDDRR